MKNKKLKQYRNKALKVIKTWPKWKREGTCLSKEELEQIELDKEFMMGL